MNALDDLLGAVCGAASSVAVGTGSPAASSMAPRSARRVEPSGVARPSPLGRATPPPTVHLVACAGDRSALCGSRDATPTLLAAMLPAARAGHARRGAPMFPLCAGCLAAVGEQPDSEQLALFGAAS